MESSYKAETRSCSNSPCESHHRILISDLNSLLMLPDILIETLEDRVIGEDPYYGKVIEPVVVDINGKEYSEYEVWSLCFSADAGLYSKALLYLEKLKAICEGCSVLPWVGGDESAGEACLYALYYHRADYIDSWDLYINQSLDFDYERYLKVFIFFYRNREGLIYIRWDRMLDFILGYWSKNLHAGLVNEYCLLLSSYLLTFLELDRFESKRIRRYFTPLGIYKAWLDTLSSDTYGVSEIVLTIVNACIYGSDKQARELVFSEADALGVKIEGARKLSGDRLDNVVTQLDLYADLIDKAIAETDLIANYKNRYGKNHFPIENTGFHFFDKEKLQWIVKG